MAVWLLPNGLGYSWIAVVGVEGSVENFAVDSVRCDQHGQ